MRNGDAGARGGGGCAVGYGSCGLPARYTHQCFLLFMRHLESFTTINWDLSYYY